MAEYSGDQLEQWEQAVESLNNGYSQVLPRICVKNSDGGFTSHVVKKYPYLDSRGGEAHYVPTAADTGLITKVEHIIEKAKFFKEQEDLGHVNREARNISTAAAAADLLINLAPTLKLRVAVAAIYQDVVLKIKALEEHLFNLDTSVNLLSYDLAGEDEKNRIKTDFIASYRGWREQLSLVSESLKRFEFEASNLRLLEAESSQAYLSTGAFKRVSKLGDSGLEDQLASQAKLWATAVNKLSAAPASPGRDVTPLVPQVPTPLEADRRAAQALSAWIFKKDMLQRDLDRITLEMSNMTEEDLRDAKQRLSQRQRELEDEMAKLPAADRPDVSVLPPCSQLLLSLNTRLVALRETRTLQEEERRQELAQNLRCMPPINIPKLKNQESYLAWRQGLRLITIKDPLKKATVLLDSIEDRQVRSQVRGLTDYNMILEVVSRQYARTSLLVPQLLRSLRTFPAARTMADFERVAAKVRNTFAMVASLGETASTYIDCTVIEDALSLFPETFQDTWERYLIDLEDKGEGEESERFSEVDIDIGSVEKDINRQDIGKEDKRKRNLFIRFLKKEEIVFANLKTRRQFAEGYDKKKTGTPDDPRGGRPPKGEPPRRGKDNKPKRTLNYATDAKKTCNVCKQDMSTHKNMKGEVSERLQACSVFRKMDPADRKATVLKVKFCLCCLGPGHNSRNCTMRAKLCTHCKNDPPHHYMICTAASSSPPSSSPPVESSAATAGADSFAPVRLMVGRAKISANPASKSVDENIFIDNGSSANFLSSQAARKIGSKGKPVTLTLTTLGREGEERRLYEHEVTLHLSDGSKRKIIAYEIERLTTSVTRHSRQMLKAYSSLFGVKESLINSTSGQAGLLLGCGALELHPKLLQMKNGLGLYHSRIGRPYWIVGKMIDSKPRKIQSPHLVDANFVDITRKDFFSTWIKTDTLGLNVEPRCASCLKAPECKVCKGMASPASFQEQEDAKVIKTHVNCDFVQKRVTATLPFKRDPHVTFHPSKSNKELVEKMALNLKKGLTRDNLLRSYTESFQEAVERGVYVEVSDEDIRIHDESGLPSNYVSHHAVLKPNSKTYSCRPVVNSSTPHSGTTLNEEVLKGGKVISNLLHVMMRSHEHPFLLICDIKRAYNAILMNSSLDQHCRRLLWYRLEDLEKEDPPLRHYLASTACFGDKPSGYFLEEAKSQLAAWCAQQGPEWRQTQEAIELNSYVDDLIKSLRLRGEAVELMERIPLAFEQLGFKLKPIVLIGPGENVPEDLPDEDMLLGYRYNYREDAFTVNFKVNFSSRRRSARICPDLLEDSELEGMKFTPASLLSLQASQYDPLGFATPFLAKGKILLSEVHKVTPGWKEELVPEHQARAMDYAREILSLVRNPVRFRRHIIGEGFALHSLFCFVDASSVALSCVIYALTKHEEGDIDTSFVCAKNALTRRSVPQNELAAIVAGNRLLHNYLLACESETLKEVIILSDSECCLAQLKPEFSPSDVYTRNKVSECHRLHSRMTVPQYYYHIPSKRNSPADSGTRADTKAEYLRSDEWQFGPQFIKDIHNFSEARLFQVIPPNSEMSQQPSFNVDANVADVQEVPPHPLLLLLDRCGTLTKAVRVVCWVRKFITLVKSHTLKGVKVMCAEKTLVDSRPLPHHVFEHTDLKNAFDTLVRATQAQFPVKDLRCRQLLSYEEDGVIYTQQRCSPATMENLFQAERLPIISPKSRLAALLVAAAHTENVLPGGAHVHFGLKQTIANSRSGPFGSYIVNSTQRCKSHLFHCIPCRKQRRLVQQAQIGLRSRLGLPAPDDGACFKDLVIDYFGPLPTKMPRQRQTRQTRHFKQYGMVVLCQSTHAVNIECVEGYDTASFKTSFNTHCARFGIPDSIMSDPMSAFISAKREIEDKDLKTDGFTDVFTAMNIKWKLIPPGSQFRTGGAEQIVKCIKSMTRFLTHHESSPALTPGEYRLLFSSISEILNRRPISYRIDDSVVKVLCPNNLLMGRPSKFSVGGGGDKLDPLARSTLIENLTSRFWKALQTTLASSNELFKAPKWASKGRKPEVNDLVLILYAGRVGEGYRIGRVTEVVDDRTVTVLVSPTQDGTNLSVFKPTRSMTVSIQRTVLLHNASDLQNPISQ